MPNKNPIDPNTQSKLNADLYESWADGNTIFADGEASGVGKQRGYNYLNESINNLQTAINEVGEGFSTVPSKTPEGVISHEFFPELDYQTKTNQLPTTGGLALEDEIPIYLEHQGEHVRTNMWALREAMGIQSPTIEVLATPTMAITVTDGTTTYTGTGSGTYPLPSLGTWTASSGTLSIEVQVTAAFNYVVDLRVVQSIEVTTPPTKTSYINTDPIDLTGAVISALYADGSKADITSLVTYSPTTADDEGAPTVPVNKTITFSYTDAAGTVFTTAQTIIVDRYPLMSDGTPSVILTQYPIQNVVPAYSSTYYRPWNTNSIGVRAFPNKTQSTQTGIGSALDPGTYSTFYTPNYLYKWGFNGSTQSFEYVWVISKSQNTIISVPEGPISVGTSPVTVSIYRKGESLPLNIGNFTVQTTNPLVAVITKETSRTVFTITGLANGNTTLSVFIPETTLSFQSNVIQIAVSVNVIDPILNNNSWATIRQCSDNNTAKNYWSVGDWKAIDLVGTLVKTNGTTQAFNIINDSVVGVRILDFLYLSANRTVATLVFGFARGGGSTATLSFPATGAFYGGMNNEAPSQSMSSYESSIYHRTLSSIAGNLLPAQLTAVLRDVNIVYPLFGTVWSANHLSKITLPSAVEIQGPFVPEDTIKDITQQLAFFSAGNRCIINQLTTTGITSPVVTSTAWLRSIKMSPVTDIYYVNGSNGASNTNTYSYNYDVSPIFFV